MTHALELPEIAGHIGSFLNKYSLQKVILVSRQWRQSFLPVLWQEFSFGENYVSKVLEKSTDVIARHAHLIQILRLIHVDSIWASWFFKNDFPSLRVIELHFDDDDMYLSMVETLKDLVLRVGTGIQSFKIEILSVRLQEDHLSTIDFLEVLKGCNHSPDTNIGSAGLLNCASGVGTIQSTVVSNLTVLSLQRVAIDLDNLSDEFRHLLAGLTSLTLDGVRFLRSKGAEEGVRKEGNDIQQGVPSISTGSKWRLVDSLFGRRDLAQPKREGRDGIKIEHLVLRLIDETMDDDQAMMNGEDQYQLILECQNLKSLTWIPSSQIFNEFPFARDLFGNDSDNDGNESIDSIDNIYRIDRVSLDKDVHRLWPRLESLNFKQSGISDSSLFKVLLAMRNRPLKELNAEKTCLHPLGVKALMGIRWTTLERLFIQGCAYVGGAIVIECLVGFPCLKEFSGPELSSDNLRKDPRPWTCLGLRKLNLPLAATKTRYSWVEACGSWESGTTFDYEGIPLLWDQIALLTQLEEFSFLDRYSCQTDNLSLSLRNISNSDDIRSNSGCYAGVMALGSWKALKRLRRVCWKNDLPRSSPMSRQDAQWMLDHWPDLEEVQAWLSPSDRNCEVVRYLEQQGILCTMVDYKK